VLDGREVDTVGLRQRLWPLSDAHGRASQASVSKVKVLIHQWIKTSLRLAFGTDPEAFQDQNQTKPAESGRPGPENGSGTALCSHQPTPNQVGSGPRWWWSEPRRASSSTHPSCPARNSHGTDMDNQTTCGAAILGLCRLRLSAPASSPPQHLNSPLGVPHAGSTLVRSRSVMARQFRSSR
jgi:hypothetical protein